MPRHRNDFPGPALIWVPYGILAFLLLIPLDAAWRQAPDLGHSWAAPLLIGYLLWERWGLRPAPAEGGRVAAYWWVVASLIVLVALPLRLLLIPYPLWPALLGFYAALLIFAALTSTWLFVGWPGVRWLGGPLTIFAAAVPWPFQIQEHLIAPLRAAMASVAAEICNLLGRPALASGTTVHLGGNWVGIDEACGGIRSLQASVMLALFFAEWCRFSPSRRAALVLVGALAACAGNFVRILFLAFRLDTGIAAFAAAHDPAGWFALLFSLSATGLVALWWFKRIGRHGAPRRPDKAEMQTERTNGEGIRPRLLWLYVVVSLLSLDEIGARGWFALGKSARADVPRWTAHLPEDLPSYQPSVLTDLGRQTLQPDRFVAGAWQEAPDLVVSAYYIEWQTGQVARFIPFAHNPTVCLPLSGCELSRDLGMISVRWKGGGILFHRYLFRRAGQEMAVAFTAWDSDRNVPLQKAEHSGGRLGWLSSRWRDVAEAQENQPAQLLSVAICGPNSADHLGRELESLISPL